MPMPENAWDWFDPKYTSKLKCCGIACRIGD